MCQVPISTPGWRECTCRVKLLAQGYRDSDRPDPNQGPPCPNRSTLSKELWFVFHFSVFYTEKASTWNIFRLISLVQIKILKTTISETLNRFDCNLFVWFFKFCSCSREMNLYFIVFAIIVLPLTVHLPSVMARSFLARMDCDNRISNITFSGTSSCFVLSVLGFVSCYTLVVDALGWIYEWRSVKFTGFPTYLIWHQLKMARDVIKLS